MSSSQQGDDGRRVAHRSYELTWEMRRGCSLALLQTLVFAGETRHSYSPSTAAMYGKRARGEKQRRRRRREGCCWRRLAQKPPPDLTRRSRGRQAPLRPNHWKKKKKRISSSPITGIPWFPAGGCNRTRAWERLKPYDALDDIQRLRHSLMDSHARRAPVNQHFESN